MPQQPSPGLAGNWGSANMPLLDGLWYEDQGQGVPVLFVHGWCMSSAVWGLQREAVAAGYRFLAVDLRGHGGSTAAGADSDGFAGYADDLVRLIRQLELQELLAVGWSLGAQVLLKAYPSLQQQLKGLVLVGATPRFSAAPHFPYGLPAKEAAGMRLKVRRSLERALEGFQRTLFVAGELDDPATAAAVAKVLSRVRLPDQTSALEGLEALMDEELLEEAGQVRCPTLLLHGSQDQTCLPAASSWLEQQIRTSRRVLFEGCGHAPFLSRSARFNQELLSFLHEVCSDV